jgi:hypothetical protein
MLFQKNINNISNSISNELLTDLRNRINIANINNGLVLSNLNLIFKKEQIENNIQEAEFKVFSQWGDDGIIDFLTNYLEISNNIFIEFGVENYTESNTRFLLMKSNWSGLVMDGSEKNIQAIRSEEIYWKYNLTPVNSFVTTENINAIIQANNFTGETGLLHIDIDGNDYWIWKAIKVVNPIIVIIEYNSIFGYSHPWTIPYIADFIRTQVHSSNLYYGTSLLSLCDLADEKGYYFIGCNSNGNNAYFIRKDKIKQLKIKTAEEGYVLSQFSESRNDQGKLTCLRGEARLDLLKGMKIFNTRTNLTEIIQ